MYKHLTNTEQRSFNLDNLSAVQDHIFTLEKGEEIGIVGSGEGNITTGYNWLVDVKDCGKGAIHVDEKYQSKTHGLLGAKGKNLFRITATKAAESGKTCKIAFVYAQPWNTPENW